ncbi:MAG: hypothetical protein KGZ58_05535 [Ignavibacteriales bacterium]|nr:hypothetical protein [Ignavibacteriales bacterium]
MSIQKIFSTIITITFLSTIMFANERKFSYTYETGVLPPGARELEIWNTIRSGKADYFKRIDQRIEFEVGVATNVQTAFYLNYSQKAFSKQSWSPFNNDSSEQKYSLQKDYSMSISNEWKLKFSDPVADPIGFGLYGEATIGLDEFELEAKLLFDKQIGKTLFAFNAVAESEWETEIEDDGEEETESEVKMEFDLGIAHSLTSNFAFGVEARQHNVIKEGEVEHSALFFGPVVSYNAETWWATFTILPQVASFKERAPKKLDMSEYEKIQARLLFSFHL